MDAIDVGRAVVSFGAGCAVLAIVVIVGIIYCLLGRGGPPEQRSK